MMTLPAEVSELARKASDSFPSDIEKAVDLFEIELKNTGLYKANSAALIRMALRGIIHGCRHLDNARLLESESSNEHSRPKVNRDAAADLVTERFLETWKIDGRVLGDVTGEELPLLATKMRQQGEGCFIRERLCLLLIPKVSRNKTVGECVTNADVGTIIAQAKSTLEIVRETVAKREDREIPDAQAILRQEGGVRGTSLNGHHGKRKRALAATA